jgi:hypothetical protein
MSAYLYLNGTKRRSKYQWGSASDHQVTWLTCVDSGTDRTSRKLTQGPAVKIGRPPSLRQGLADVGDRSCHLKVAGQDSACKFGAGVFDATPPELDSSVQKLATADR